MTIEQLKVKAKEDKKKFKAKQ